MKRLRYPVLLTALALFGGIGWLVLSRTKAPAAPKARPIAVTIFATEARDVPVWLSGLGTVQANQTVTLRPQVSGQLAAVHFTEGQEVKAGDLLAQIDPRPAQAALQQAVAQKAQNEARRANDRREYERVAALVETRTESLQLLDQRASALAQSTALVQVAQAAVDTAQLQLDFTAVRAPIDGRTGVRLIDAGNLVTANQPGGLVVLTQTRPVAVVFALPQQALPALRRPPAQPGDGPLAVEVLSDQGHPLARGRLDLIDNQIDPASGTLRLKATFANDDQALWPGQFVNTRVLVNTLTRALVVPTEAVQPGLDGPFVYVVKADATVEARTLQLGPTVNGFTVVTAGLAAGDPVVREGQNKLQPGARIELAKPAPVASSTSPASGAKPVSDTAAAKPVVPTSTTTAAATPAR
jgi:multidrug efflux system membrane fusion protein